MRLHNILSLYIHEYYWGVPSHKIGGGYSRYLLAIEKKYLLMHSLYSIRSVYQIFIYHSQKDAVSIPNT